MHRPDPETLIPGIPLEEYQPAGHPAVSALALILLKIGFGYRAWGRRVWVNSSDADGYPLLVSVEVEEVHCRQDARRLRKAGRPPKRLLSRFEPTGLTVRDVEAEDIRLDAWSHAGLSFELWTVTEAQYLFEVIFVDRVGRERFAKLPELVAEVRSNLPDRAPSPGLCVANIRRWAIMAVVFVVLTAPAFFTPTLASTVGVSDGAFRSVHMLVVIPGLFAIILQGGRRGAQELERVLTQGDNDGTIRRALASIGIDLPEATPPAP